MKYLGSITSDEDLVNKKYVDDSIPTVPTKTSDLTNDSGFITSGALPTKVSDLTNDLGFITTETDPTVPSWAKANSKPSYTAGEVGAVPTTRTVNSKALSSDVSLTASDVGAQPTLVSGTNIKTINNTSLLGAGNITIDYLPLTGGTITGNLTVNGSTQVNTLNGFGITGDSGDWWGKIPTVQQANGVMGIGRYIDFHTSDTGTSDYDARLYANSGQLVSNQDFHVNGKLTVASVQSETINPSDTTIKNGGFAVWKTGRMVFFAAVGDFKKLPNGWTRSWVTIPTAYRPVGNFVFRPQNQFNYSIVMYVNTNGTVDFYNYSSAISTANNGHFVGTYVSAT